MTGVSLPVTRPVGRAMVIGSAESRAALIAMLAASGQQCVEADDPYAAMAEICPRPLAYRAVILSLGSIYREELRVISSLKARFPHLEIWLGQTDGRAAALAEATGLGADGLLAADGLHRFASSAGANNAAPGGNNAGGATGATRAPAESRVAAEPRPAAEPQRPTPTPPTVTSAPVAAFPPAAPQRVIRTTSIPPAAREPSAPRPEPQARQSPPVPEAVAASDERTSFEEDLGLPEPVLTADELRALLQEQPTRPPTSEDL